jgi:hypothetical protein
MDTQTFIGFGFANSNVGAHRMAKASCDQQAQAVANAFAALVKCEGNCKPVGTTRIVNSKEFGPVKIAPGWWIDLLEITYDLIVNCVQPRVPPAPGPVQTLPGDIAPVTGQSKTRRPRKQVRKRK